MRFGPVQQPNLDNSLRPYGLSCKCPHKTKVRHIYLKEKVAPYDTKIVQEALQAAWDTVGKGSVIHFCTF